MSRSRKKFPAHGIAGCSSEKEFKKLEHRSYRAACRIALIAGRDLPGGKLYGDPWTGPKDGKSIFDPKKYPDMMRK